MSNEVTAEHTPERERLGAMYLELGRVMSSLEKLQPLIERHYQAVAWRDSRLALVGGDPDDVLPAVFRRPADALFHAIGSAWCLVRSCDAVIKLAGASSEHADLARYHRGLRLWAREIIHAFSDGRDLDATYLGRIDKGLRTLHKQTHARDVEDVTHWLAEIERDQAELRAMGLGSTADRIERDTHLKRLVADMKAFVRGPVEQLY